MKHSLTLSSPPPPCAMRPGAPRTRRAMTLIEIIAGLVILSTILASLAIARGRFARQWAEADRKLTATRALDALVAEWMQKGDVPLNRKGVLPEAKNLFWRTRAIR